MNNNSNISSPVDGSLELLLYFMIRCITTAASLCQVTFKGCNLSLQIFILARKHLNKPSYSGQQQAGYIYTTFTNCCSC